MSHKGCLSVTKYFLFLFNLFFFVSIWLVGEGQAGDQGRGPGRGRAEGGHLACPLLLTADPGEPPLQLWIMDTF